MGRNSRRNSKERFLKLPYKILNSVAYKSLNSWAVKLLIDIGGQYNGSNNGDLCAPFSMLKERGWNSPSTLNKALKQLKDNKLIVITRQGGRNQCSLYALTWLGIDECKGKM